VARGRRLTIALALLAARAALAADPCEEGRLLTGLAVSAAADGLAIAAVDDESPAAAGGFRVGDRLVQANASVLTSCDEWARAVRDARRERKALLLLVRRPDGEVPLMLAQATWTRAVAVAPARPPTPPTEVPSPPTAAPRAPTTAPTAPTTAPTAPAAAPAPPPKPRPVEPPSVAAIVKEPPPAAGVPSAQLDEVLKALESLVPAEPATARIAAYQQQLLRVHRQIESLAARSAAPPQAIAGLRTVVRYYDAAEVAWEADEALRERDKRPRHIPTGEGTAAPYFIESDAEATIDEFPFLRETVVREPGTATIEISGLWRPVQARTMLWEKGREELGRLTQWLGSRP
jgi:hypothetical protein